MSEAAHSPSYYVKIWAVLTVLLVVSIIGPELGIPIVTLITAFGIAVVKAYMVCAYFMHLNIEKKMVWYMLLISLVLIGVFYAATSVDVMFKDGQNWYDCISKQTCVEQLQ